MYNMIKRASRPNNSIPFGVNDRRFTVLNAIKTIQFKQWQRMRKNISLEKLNTQQLALFCPAVVQIRQNIVS